MPGALTDKQVKHLLRIGGLEGEAEVVAIGGPANLLAALERKQIDGFAISMPQDRTAVARGHAVMWVDNAAGDDPAIDPFMMESLLTTQTWADENPDVVKAMIRALRRAVADLSSKSATVPLCHDSQRQPVDRRGPAHRHPAGACRGGCRRVHRLDLRAWLPHHGNHEQPGHHRHDGRHHRTDDGRRRAERDARQGRGSCVALAPEGLRHQGTVSSRAADNFFSPHGIDASIAGIRE